MIYIEDIIEELKKEGYVNKLVDYAEFTKLYEKYQKYYSDKEFAQILGIEYGNYMGLKSGKNNARILKSELNEVSEERKKEIVEELIDREYKGKSINYEQFKDLYEPYKKEMGEKEFAQTLCIGYSNYRNLKSGRSNARILKSELNEVPEERKKEIVEELIGKGYKEKLINYEQFIELYEPYEKEMVDREFAEILGVKYANYRNLKSGRSNARILKPKLNEVSEERKKEIVENLSNKGYRGKSISYEKFKELYEPYKKEMIEKEFAQILGVEYDNYMALKSGRQNARILKEKAKEVPEERKKEIVEELIDKGYKEKLINYEKFKELYEPYKKEMIEKEFAQILGVEYGNYMSLKSGRSNARILKEKAKEVPEERKKEIVEELIDKGHRNKLINYEKFKELYEPYKKEIIEKEFAKILGIGYANYQHLRSGRQNARILKEKAKGVAEKRKKEIVEELSNKGYRGKAINYEKFKELYEPYKKEMLDKEFAEILGIGYANYQNLKSGRQNARILKEKVKVILEERKKEIVERIIGEGYKGKLINYEQFKELYEPYKKEMAEKELAKILGIESNYGNLKYGKRNARILKTAISEMKYKIENGDEEYTKKDIEKISKQYVKTENDFLITAFGENYKIYKEILNKKGKVYVKKERMSNEFIEKHGELMLNEIKNISYNDTDFQEEILYRIIDTGKYIEKNAKDDKDIEKIIISEIRKIAKEVQTKKYYEKISEKSLDANILYNNKGEKKEIIAQTKDEKVDIEKQINLKIDKENNTNMEAEKCIELMQEYVDEGKSREEIIELVSKKLNIDKEKMLKIIKEELHRRIKIEQEYEL